MRIITQEEILCNESIEVLTLAESKELYNTLPTLKNYNLFYDKKMENVYHYFADEHFKPLLATGEKNLDTMCNHEAEKHHLHNFYFMYDKNALYILVDSIPLLKCVGKIHDLLKYDNCLIEFKNEFFVSGVEYATLLLPYKELTNNYVSKYAKVNYSNEELNYKIDKGDYYPSQIDMNAIAEKFYKHCEKMCSNSLTELVGVLESPLPANIKNTIGAKESTLFDIQFPHFENAQNFVEILRIDEADLIIGEKGILQLFVNPMDNWLQTQKWYDEKYYTWHFTPQERVDSMKKITALRDTFLDVKEELGSEIVLPFAIKETRRLYSRLLPIISLEHAKVISSFIEPDDKARAVYQAHYNFYGNKYYQSLNTYAKYDVENVLHEFENNLDKDEKTIIYFSDFFTTQYYKYKDKENEKFLLSIRSDNAYVNIKDKYQNNKRLYALCIGDSGSLTFAMDETAFNKDKCIEITEFNTDCY